MVLLKAKHNYYNDAAVLLSVLIAIILFQPCIAGDSNISSADIMVNNVWVDVPLEQIFRDISIETGTIIATCPHVPDPLVSLDAANGKQLDKCLSELIAGQGLYISKKGEKFYLITCGNPTCPSAMETATSKRVYLKYITAKHLKASLPKSSLQYVTSGERENEVLIYAMPEITKNIMDIIQKLDIPGDQVVLEVLVVDLWENTGDELGFDWSYSGPHNQFGMSEGIAGFIGSASYASVAASNLVELSLTLRALVSEKRASIRSRPRVATLNGEKAMIDISLEEYYSIATNLYGTSLRTELEVIKSGVMLEITPHIGDDGYITIDVLTEVSDVASRRDTSRNKGISGGDLPVIRRRKADTRVRVREGDAMVIGGLIESQETTDHKSVPMLSSMPIIGGLFKSKSDSTSKKEVMIFITPRLMREGQAVTSNKYELINETEEVENMRDEAALFAVSQKLSPEIDSNSHDTQYLEETKILLGAQDQPQHTQHETDIALSEARLEDDSIAQERKMLQDVIVLLEVQSEQMPQVVKERKKNKKYEGSF